MREAKQPKIAEIAERIAAHLLRMEKTDPKRGSSRCAYYMPNAWAAGPRVGVRYVSYQSTTNLTKADALEYLAWLDAGNEGSHYKALSFNTRMAQEARDA